MNIIETTFEKLPTKYLLIGFEGENLRATVRIDCASVFAEYPNATPTLIVKPLFADAYPVVVDRNGTDVDWLITSEILSFTGDGEIQLVFYKDQVICKSAVSKIRVSRSLTVTGEMPDPVVQWIENANRKLAEVDAQITELEGMVDTATDAATRAEQSASTASAKAEQAAGSAATATEKATEATNAAGTATAKAAEAEQSALTATDKANAAAESERIATAKAGEATTAAETATAKAEQATEAAQTATEKAGDASASARAAQESANDAASSATAASASETVAKASETAASTSASQAAQSVLDAGTAAQTATQKAAEATQSATNAATFAGTATAKAEEAAESAQAAQDAQTAVEQTAEQLADSLEQIEQNTQDIAELDERKANIDGYYPDMTVGNAEQLNSSKYVENSEPYTLRTSGGSSDIGNREYLDAVVGGTLAWNQAVRDEASENQTDFAPIVTVTDAVEDAAGVKVKLEPVQDLHGYDHPWPGGGGKNKFCDVFSEYTKPTDYYVFPITLAEGTYRLWASKTKDTVTGCAVGIAKSGNRYTDFDGLVLVMTTAGNTNSTVLTVDSTWTDPKLCVYCSDEATFNSIFENYNVQLESGAMSTSYEPYSNICPITRWDGVKVTRSGGNLLPTYTESVTQNGITYTANADGSVTVNGTATATNTYTAPFGTWTWDGAQDAWLSGCPTGGDYYKGYSLRLDGGNGGWAKPDIGDGIKLADFGSSDPIVGRRLKFCIVVRNGTVCNNFVFKPMLNFGNSALPYEEYKGMQTYSITLPTEAGTVYGGELTVNADGSGSLVVDRAKYIANANKLVNFYNGTSTTGAGYALDVRATEHTVSSVYPDAISGTCKTLLQIYWAVGHSAAGLKSRCDNETVNYSAFSINGGYLTIYDPDNTMSEADFKEKYNSAEFVYQLEMPVEYQLTADQITTLLGQNNIWADTGDLALTYTGTDEHLTLESGKKYLSRISGTDSMLLGSGQEITAAKGTDNVFNLTQMFGTAVADYVYGQGAAFFRKWFGKQWYPYNAGELLSVEELLSHDMVGFNQWDEEWEEGAIASADGGRIPATGRIRSKNFIPIMPNTTYYIRDTLPTTASDTLYFYDADKNYLGYALQQNKKNQTFVTPNNAWYMKFNTPANTGGTYSGGICINLSHNNSRDGEYEPYEKHSYPLDSSVILRGIPKVGANGVYWDGDRYLPDGTVERRYGIFTFSGIENWEYIQAPTWACSAFRLSSGQAVSNFAKGASIKMIEYSTVPVKTAWNEIALVGNKVVGTITQSVGIVIRDDSITSLSDFRTWINGKSIIYELAEPTTETAQPYHSTQWVSDWGTEEFVSTSIVPVGTETRYPANLRDKLQHLPDAASGNGSYLITQTDGQMVLTPFPAPPSSAGNYILKATVVNGVATYTWEVAT